MSTILVASFAAVPQAARAQASKTGDEAPQCPQRQEPAWISSEIVVCGDRSEPTKYRLRTDEAAAFDYAAATMNKGLGPKPDFRSLPCKQSLLVSCPNLVGAPPRAIGIDFYNLPEAPPGSDAVRLNEEAPLP